MTWPHDTPPGPDEHTVAVTHRGEPVGEIAVAKAPGDPLRPAEETLLRDLAAQAGLALHNVRLNVELRGRLEEIAAKAASLRESQRRLLTAADEERRRLERTIEEGPERGLRDMAARLEEAERVLGTEPDIATRLLESLQERARSTLEELREFARGIFPPLLADRGLAAALEAQVRKVPIAVEVDAAGVERFSEEAEAGIYFCVVEALAEAVDRGATGAAIRLVAGDGTLGFSVTDDAGAQQPAGGRWTPARRRIADRVEALGGALEVSSVPRGGTTLAGRIPMEEKEPVH
ncbi:MAG: sensor histidine kinase [Actinomycetota bacterium]